MQKLLTEETSGNPVLQRFWRLILQIFRKLWKSLQVQDLPSYIFQNHQNVFQFQWKQIWVWLYTFPCTSVKKESQHQKWYTVNDKVKCLKYIFLPNNLAPHS